MNRIAGVMRTQLQDRLGWIFLPWIIMLSSFAINWILGYTMQEEQFYTGGLASIYVYMLVLGVMSVIQSFPFVIGFGVRRKDYFWGTLATITSMSAVFAVLLWVLGYVESELTGGWGAHVHFFHLPYIGDGSAIAQIWVSFSLLIHFFFLGFIISCIHRRFGRAGTFTLLTAIPLILTVTLVLINYYKLWSDLGDWFSGVNSVELATGLFGLSLIYSLLSYLLLRRSTV
ncbi:hypothetical protein [Paenibacillus sp. sgz500958]|uniref:hypothetical protein n=1 Tax=Paenibacillus sp. sgz500958 TaxID=3242475 RepID=UPI0036D3019D